MPKIAILVSALAVVASVLAYFVMKEYVERSIERMRFGDYG